MLSLLKTPLAVHNKKQNVNVTDQVEENKTKKKVQQKYFRFESQVNRSFPVLHILYINRTRARSTIDLAKYKQKIVVPKAIIWS